MRKKNYKGRVTKRYLPKCNDICRTYDPIMTAYADLVSKMEEVEEFRCNVYLEGLTEGDYTTDFLVKMKDGTFMVRECVYRSRITKAWNKLTPAQQDAMMEAGKLASQYCREVSEDKEKEVLEQLKSEGCNVVEVSDIKPWQDAVAKVIDDNVNTDELKELYQKLLDLQ